MDIWRGRLGTFIGRRCLPKLLLKKKGPSFFVAASAGGTQVVPLRHPLQYIEKLTKQYRKQLDTPESKGVEAGITIFCFRFHLDSNKATVYSEATIHVL